MADAQHLELPPHEMEEAGAALAGALGGLRTIWAGVGPPAASVAPTQLAPPQRDPTKEPSAPSPAEVKPEAERDVEGAAAGEAAAEETAAAGTLAEEGAAAKEKKEVGTEVETAAAETVAADTAAAAELVVATKVLELLEAMSLDELRDRCRKSELDDKGDKQQLIERAQAFLAEQRAEKRRFEASLPPKVAYHPNVCCRRGVGCTCGKGDADGTRCARADWPHPVIVGPMYRVGEVCVCEGAASEEEKASGPVAPAVDWRRKPVEGFDLRGWKAADIQGLRGADGTFDLECAIICGVDLTKAELQGAILRGAQLQGARLGVAQLQGARLMEAQLQGAILSSTRLQGANLSKAQLQGADLGGAQLHGAILDKAQLQGANLGRVELQGAHLNKAQFQGANLNEADLQGASLVEAQLQGANLSEARLQGASLHRAQLQGANLTSADLSVLPKGFLLPKRCFHLGETEARRTSSSPGETEATDKDRPTLLIGANLSVLPKGSKYCKPQDDILILGVKVSDTARPTNLTNAKASGANFKDAELKDANLTEATASGAIFTGADLSGANFTGATIEGATLKDATFAPLRPPDRPASGALHKAWKAKALLTAVARAGLAAADNDDDDDSSDGGESEDEDAEEEEESPVEVKVEEFLDAFMNRLDTAGKNFVLKVDHMLNEVDGLLNESLLKSGDQIILAELLCSDLKKASKPSDKRAVISETLSKHVVSPFFEQHLPKVLTEALNELSVKIVPTVIPPVRTGGGGLGGGGLGGGGLGGGGEGGVLHLDTPELMLQDLQKQLLGAFKKQALSHGKAAFLKHLSPMVSKFAATVSSISEDPALLDEEEALMRPEESADCFVEELWKMLRASLEAQARRPSAHTAQQLPLLHYFYTTRQPANN